MLEGVKLHRTALVVVLGRMGLLKRACLESPLDELFEMLLLTLVTSTLKQLIVTMYHCPAQSSQER